MEDKIKFINYNRASVTPDVARVLDTLIKNVAEKPTISELSSQATLPEVVAKINEIIKFLKI